MENYFLGLDIGTNSVGYAVTDEKYNLRKYKGEPMWGSHVFEEGKQAAERRGFRTGRRRLNRRQQRVLLVQEIFAEEINKVDPRFFIRIQESALDKEDSSQNDRFTLFNDEQYSEKNYYKQYPTIHHLIADLMKSKESHDIRLVYLACAWLVAHRGHFLSEVNRDNVSEVLDFNKVYSDFISYLEQNGIDALWNDGDESKEIIKEILLRKEGVTKKVSDFKAELYGGKFNSSEDERINPEQVIRLLSGAIVDAEKVFPDLEQEETVKICFKKSEEEFLLMLEQVGEYAEFLIKLRGLYDWSLLYEASGGSTSISEAKVKIYEVHQEDLKFLKYFIKKYLPKKYKEVFAEAKDDNYVAYSYHTKGMKQEERKNCKDKATQEEFCNYIKKMVSNLEVEETDRAKYEDMIARLELLSFMPKQVMGDNRVIPYQLYYYELKEILENATSYLPFINEKDKDGYTAKEKLLSIMEYRVPYYVGPLHKDDNAKYAWIVRRDQGRIYPWNFSDKVDLDASEQAFMEKLTNTCSYIPGEKVLPKNSLLYSKFTLLNEINKLKINDEPISVPCKQGIYNDLFMKYRTVSVKRIREYLICNKYMSKDDALSGLDISVKSNLKSYHDFKKLIESGFLTRDDAEQIIAWSTYSEDKKRYRDKIKKTYSNLPDEDIKYLSKLNYSDFGRLSYEFLSGFTAIDQNTGEMVTIIRAMWEYNLNLNELLFSELFGFKKELEKIKEEYYSDHPSNLETLFEDMYVSNAVRRPIYRTLDIVKDVVKANHGKAPSKIFVEMARGGGEKGVRTKTRRVQIEEKFSEYKKYNPNDVKELSNLLNNKSDNDLQDEKLYLYFMQLGKCMYSGESIDIERLNTKLYDVDHILPQSKVKDDSISNKVLVLSRLNGEKQDNYPLNFALPGVQEKMASLWKSYCDRGLISQEKYKRLIRKKAFTDDELMGFIQRQIVETRQSTKAIATIFKHLYPESEIVYVKAGLVSDFRKEFDILKCRAVNDLHHAKDAYLNIVCGDVYHTRFTKKFYIKEPYTLKTDVMFSHAVKDGERIIWNGKEDIARIKKTVLKNNVHYTRYSFIRKGGLFNQNPERAKEGLIPRKDGLDTVKYGGYNNSTAAGFIMAKYTDITKKRVTDIMFVPVEVMSVKRILADEGYAIKYIQDNIAKIEGRDVKNIVDISFPLGMKMIKINTVLLMDGVELAIAAKSNGGKIIVESSLNPLIISYENVKYIKSLVSFSEKKKKNKKIELDVNYDGISLEKNENLYSLLKNKISNSSFKKILGNQEGTLEMGKEKFDELTLEEQVDVLLNLVNLFTTGRTTGCNIKAIGGSGQAGIITTSSKLSNIIKGKKDVRLKYQSASGIYSSVSENLVDLL